MAVAPNDPELYFGFLSLEDAIGNDAAKATSAAAAGLQHGAAQTFGISDQDFAASLKVAHSTVLSVDSVNAAAAAAATAAAAANQPVNLQAFQAQRLSAIQSGIKALQGAVSAVGWQSLQSYINGPYRGGITHVEVTNAKP